MNDSIANMIIMLKNAGDAHHETVSVPFTELKNNIANVLKREGFINGFSKKGKKIAKTLEIEIAYNGSEPKINGVERISKFSRRIYAGFKDIKSVRNGYGATILSTPMGIMTGNEAREKKVGGEVLFKIW